MSRHMPFKVFVQAVDHFANFPVATTAALHDIVHYSCDIGIVTITVMPRFTAVWVSRHDLFRQLADLLIPFLDQHVLDGHRSRRLLAHSFEFLFAPSASRTAVRVLRLLLLAKGPQDPIGVIEAQPLVFAYASVPIVNGWTEVRTLQKDLACRVAHVSERAAAQQLMESILIPLAYDVIAARLPHGHIPENHETGAHFHPMRPGATNMKERLIRFLDDLPLTGRQVFQPRNGQRFNIGLV